MDFMIEMAENSLDIKIKNSCNEFAWTVNLFLSIRNCKYYKVRTIKNAAEVQPVQNKYLATVWT